MAEDILTTQNSESGRTPHGDYYATHMASEHAAQPDVKTHPMFNTASNGPVVHQHQPPADARKIGVPGSGYMPHEDDHIMNHGGNQIIFGGDPSNPCLRFQSADGSAIELSKDGIKIVSTGHLHQAAAREIQQTCSGDHTIAAGGGHKVKANHTVVDTGQHTMTNRGDHVENIHGDHNSHVYGEKHTAVAQDSSETYGADHRSTHAGSVTTQVAGNHNNMTGGKYNMAAADDISMHTDKHAAIKTGLSMALGTGSKGTGNFSVMVGGDSSHHVSGKHETVAGDDMTHSTKGAKYTLVKGDHNEGIGGSHNKQTGGDQTHDTKGSTTHNSGQSHTTHADQDHTITAGGAHTLNAGGSMNEISPTRTMKHQSALSTSHPVSPTTYTPPPAPNKAKNAPQPKDPETKVKPNSVTIPKPEDIMDAVSHLRKTKVERIVTNSMDMYNKYSEQDGSTEPPQEVIQVLKDLGDNWPPDDNSQAI